MNLDYARQVIQSEAAAISALAERIDDSFDKAAQLVFNCSGRVIVTGVGKAGIIGQKISATLASTGTPSYWLHPTEARHGDLGRIVGEDIVLAISNSGQSEEIIRLLPSVKKIGAKIMAITGNRDSTLAHYSDLVIDIGKITEACPLGLAPSASTTAMLAIGDALALTVLKERDFSKEEFAFYHPGGELGRQLMKAREIMRTSVQNPTVPQDTPLKEALKVITNTEGRAGAVCIVDESQRLIGIFTDGDLRRYLQQFLPLDESERCDFLNEPIGKVMTESPKMVKADDLASHAFKILREYKIDELPVVDEAGRLIGIIDVQDILAVGMV